MGYEKEIIWSKSLTLKYYVQVGPNMQHVLTECATGYIVEQINHLLGT